ncbi:hypothetical protein ASG31_02845 [Chryseobacterium sp. Leaf404]|uniref:hypothetical protein n=1 Tax=unclassified Chryseobacterium TaxID=2593645 RepID=UPI0006FB67E9|nr:MULTISPECIES: hypothetical protein [unclassified Chryseobacterium]KQT22293.1 hypothetical protein ASG31_02845 [Chryseobacterium sp. Leaf404]
MTKTDKYILFSILNVILLITVMFKTVVNFYLFIIIISLICFFINKLINKKLIKIKNGDKKYFFSVTFPLTVNCFFLINYFTGMNPQKETYCFKNMISEVGGRNSHQKGKTTYIYLSENAYPYSYMTRSFLIDYKRMWGNNQIIYTFERGIFGLKARKNFQFVYNENCPEN